MLKNSNKQIMTIKNLISLSSLHYTINFVHQPCPPNLIIATFFSLNHGPNLLHQSYISSMTSTNSFKKIWGFWFSDSIKKIRVWSFSNWGRTLTVIIGRIFGDFGV